MSEVKVVILAAGKGTRMGAAVPKPLVEVAGKPMIQHLLDRVRKAKIDTKPVVIVSSEGLPLFAQALGGHVTLVVQKEQNGTGDALRYAEEAVGAAEHVIVLYGDHPFIGSDVLRRLVDLLDNHKQAVAILTAEVPHFQNEYTMFMKWGRVLRDDEGQVTAIREAKDCSPEEIETREINPGIYAFPAAWAFDRLKAVRNENASGEYYLVDLIAMAMSEGKQIVTEIVNPLDVAGINTPDELKKVEQLFTQSL